MSETALSKNGLTLSEALAKLKNARYLRPDEAIGALKGASGQILDELFALARSLDGDEAGMIPIYALEALASCEDERKLGVIRELAASPNELMRDAASRALDHLGLGDQAQAIQKKLLEEMEEARRRAEERAAQEQASEISNPDLENMAAIYASMPLEQLAKMNQMLQDKFFFFYQVFENLKKMSSVYDQDRLNELLLQSAKQFIRNKFSLLFLAEEEKNDRLSFAASMDLEKEKAEALRIAGPMLERFRNDREMVNIDQLEMESELKTELPPFKDLECVLFLPLVNKDELIGLVIVGPKATGEDYSGEDLELIKTFLDLGAVSVANAALYASQQKLIGNMFGQTLL